eukprot:TRINITY_DN14127_c0_g1_i1.p1 TRINITY_DN14127_c0_g1~~TRINITY_DN14127_c0_g1_i1.p1  ORF type:complete len:189 (-),score=25.05 TRINITY_DN14127_c0_g1_i1:43-537(-)
MYQTLDDVNVVKGNNEWTALHLAAFIGKNSETVKALIDIGVDINALDAQGRTALHLACQRRNLEAALALGNKGGVDKEALDYAPGYIKRRLTKICYKTYKSSLEERFPEVKNSKRTRSYKKGKRHSIWGFLIYDERYRKQKDQKKTRLRARAWAQHMNWWYYSK